MCQTVSLPVAWTLEPSFGKKPLRWDKTMPSEQMLIAGGAQWGRGSSTLEDGLGTEFGKSCATGLGLGERCGVMYKKFVSAIKKAPRYEAHLLFPWLTLVSFGFMGLCLI